MQHLVPLHALHPTLEGRHSFAMRNAELDLEVFKRSIIVTAHSDPESLVWVTLRCANVRRHWTLKE